MEERGYADFSAQFLSVCPRSTLALILDLRGNVGGMTSDLILARLTQHQLALELPAYGLPAAVPEHAAPRALVLIIDENTCSDGEVLAEHLSAATHATIVGSRSWGGIIGMG